MANGSQEIDAGRFRTGLGGLRRARLRNRSGSGAKRRQSFRPSRVRSLVGLRVWVSNWASRS